MAPSVIFKDVNVSLGKAILSPLIYKSTQTASACCMKYLWFVNVICSVLIS